MWRLYRIGTLTTDDEATGDHDGSSPYIQRTYEKRLLAWGKSCLRWFWIIGRWSVSAPEQQAQAAQQTDDDTGNKDQE